MSIQMCNFNDFIIEDGVLKEYVGPGGDVAVPEQVTMIGWEAFSWCRSLQSVTIPDSVTRIKKSAFYRCKNLQRVILPDTVPLIAEKVFSKCTGLKEITIPSGVQKIDSFAFAECLSLETVLIQGPVRVIAREAFANCPQLCLVAPQVPLAVIKAADLLFPAACGFLQASEQYRDPEILSAYRKYITGQKKRLLSFLFRSDLVSGLAAYDTLGKISRENFETDFFTPAQNVGASQCIAWLLNWKHRHISVADEERQLLRELNKDPFNVTDMKKLWSYRVLSGGVLQITGYKGGESELLVPSRIGKDPVTSIGEDAFSPGKKRRIAAQRQLLREIKAVTLPYGITAIGKHAFRGCEALESVTIPDSVRVIRQDAFFGCDGLTIYAPAGSFAQTYAKENNIPFVAT